MSISTPKRISFESRVQELLDRCSYYYKKICTYDGLVNDVEKVNASLDETLANSREALQIAKNFSIRLDTHDNDLIHIRNRIGAESIRQDHNTEGLAHLEKIHAEQSMERFIDQDNKIESLNKKFQEELCNYVTFEKLFLEISELEFVMNGQADNIRQQYCLYDDVELQLSIQKDFNKSLLERLAEQDKELARLRNELVRISYQLRSKGD